jgi:hypothetical protein
MGKKWDYDVPSVEVWAECLRVLKPGGHLLAFAGTRTQHRMAVRIEDAGFEIRDMIAWVYGSGFPKSHNLKDDWKGWGTALKPALEPITMARKPFPGTVAANVAEWGTGAINVDGCRVGTEQVQVNSYKGRGPFGESQVGNTYDQKFTAGRWPSNLIHDGSEEVLAGFPANAGGGFGRNGDGSNTVRRQMKFAMKATGETVGYGDSGSAARFFYVAKASRADRDGSPHPTMKPTALMQYLCRLVTPPGGTVLDPFCGSGSTGKAAMLEGFNFVGMEREAEYVEIARRRIAEAAARPMLEGIS